MREIIFCILCLFLIASFAGCVDPEGNDVLMGTTAESTTNESESNLTEAETTAETDENNKNNENETNDENNGWTNIY